MRKGSLRSDGLARGASLLGAGALALKRVASLLEARHVCQSSLLQLISRTSHLRLECYAVSPMSLSEKTLPNVVAECDLPWLLEQKADRLLFGRLWHSTTRLGKERYMEWNRQGVKALRMREVGVSDKRRVKVAAMLLCRGSENEAVAGALPVPAPRMVSTPQA